MPNNKDIWTDFLRSKGMDPVEVLDTFQFGCAPECWGTCCTGSRLIPAHIKLGLDDVNRLRKLTGLPRNADFLDRHGVWTLDDGWPLVELSDAMHGPCHFLDRDSGRCSIYADRPNACRSSPIAPTVFWDSSGELDIQYMKRLPHPHCQRKNPSPPAEQRVDTFIKEAGADWQWSTAATKLHMWALKHLSYEAWVNDEVIRQVRTFLYRFDEYVPADTSDEETYSRAIEATRYFLRFVAAYRGFGPDLGTHPHCRFPERATAGAKQILAFGYVDEDVLRQSLESIPSGGYDVVDSQNHDIVQSYAGDDTIAAAKVAEFLKKRQKKRQKIERWIVVHRHSGKSIQATAFLAQKSALRPLAN